METGAWCTRPGAQKKALKEPTGAMKERDED
jgi:hypothetical protein